VTNDPANVTNNFVEENSLQEPHSIPDPAHGISMGIGSTEHEANQPRIPGVSMSELELPQVPSTGESEQATSLSTAPVSPVGDSPRGPLKQWGKTHLKPRTKPDNIKPNHAGA
jgi:hypothetical protein